MKFGRRYSFILLFTIFLFSSCGKKDDSVKIQLTDSFEWALTNAESTVEDAQELNYSPVSFKRSYNLEKLVGSYGNYVWLRAHFVIPEELKDIDLAMSISYLHFADKVWLNGNFIGEYGSFPPKEQSALYEGHYYEFPQILLNQNDENEILIKVWCHGRSEVSNQIFISDKQTASIASRYSTMKFSKIYMYTEGGMFTAFLICLLFYLGRKKEKEYLYFAIMNLFSLQLAMIFFVSELPEYSKNLFNFVWLYKYIPCICFYGMIFCFSLFMIHYIKGYISRRNHIIHACVFIFTSIITLLAKDYNALIKIYPYMMTITMIQIPVSAYEISDVFRQKKSQIIIFAFSIFPILMGALVDFILRGILYNANYPYYTYFGWQITIIIYLVNITIRYNNVYSKMEYLAENLQHEVDAQTKALSVSNAELEKEIKKSNIDLKMAAIVQKKFLPEPDMVFVGWDVAVSYEPLAEVSGDLYDYYNMGKMLDGFALFDVSGHGIASSLITTLAKNIIYETFRIARFSNKHISLVMSEIDKKIKLAKGSIENYLTGVLFRFSLFDKNDVCDVEFSNAGHPNPLLYIAAENRVVELKSEDSQHRIGAIGMNAVDVQCTDIHFKMSQDDILICYTDGLTEALNEKGQQFGKENVKKIIEAAHCLTSRDIVESLKNALNEHLGDCLREDDVTIIVMKRENSKDYLEPIG